MTGWYWEPLPYLGIPGSLAAILYAFARCRPIRVPLADWGWRRGRAVWLELAIGLIAGFLLRYLRYLPGAVSVRLDSSMQFWSALIVLSSLVWSPIIQETFYRGMLYRHLRDRWQWPVAAVVSAAVFAAAHQPVSRWPNVLVGGIVYALLREWRGSLLAPMAAHATFNAATMLNR